MMNRIIVTNKIEKYKMKSWSVLRNKAARFLHLRCAATPVTQSHGTRLRHAATQAPGTVDVVDPLASPGEAPPLLYRAPTLSPAVAGRQGELLTLWQQLLAGKRLQFLVGADGVGKSTIAAEFCDRARRSHRFSCIQWCQGRHSFASQLQKLMEEMKGRKELDVLLVVDDAADVATVLKVLPKHPQFYVLITTSVPLPEIPANAGITTVRPLQPAEAVELLPPGMKELSSDETLRRVFEFCEYVPLLLQVAVPLVTEKVILPQALLRQLEASGARSGTALSVSGALATMLELSVGAAEAQFSGAREALRRLSCVHLGDISDAVLGAVVEGDVAAFTTVTSRFALLTIKWESSAYAMHRTTAEVLRRGVTQEELTKTATQLAVLWPRRWREIVSTQGYPLAWHSYALFNHFKALKAPLSTPLLRALDRSALFLAHYARQDLPLAAEMWCAVFDTYSSRKEAPDREAVRVGRECGRLLHFLRDPRAQAVLETSYRWSGAVHGQDSVESALVLGCLAPYLDATPAAIAALDAGVAALEAALGGTEIVLGAEESRMLQETVFVLLVRKGQMLQETGKSQTGENNNNNTTTNINKTKQQQQTNHRRHLRRFFSVTMGTRAKAITLSEASPSADSSICLLVSVSFNSFCTLVLTHRVVTPPLLRLAPAMPHASPLLSLSKKSVDDIWPVTGKRVLVRTDFNVPVHGGVIENDFHIRCAIPTIRRVIDQGGICILLSHRGRPTGVDMATAEKELELRRPAVSLGQGRTAFFGSLPGEAKALILSWSSQRDKAVMLPVDRSSGKSNIFAALPDEEKTLLLNRYVNETSVDRLHPPGYEEEYSLHIVAVRLAELLDQNVFFAHDCLHARDEIRKRRCGEVVLLENVRFYKEENSQNKSARLQFAKVLASYGDVFINDAFGISHRETATVTGIPEVIGHSAAGYWMQREISSFSKALSRPASPLTAIAGGAKASDKIALLRNLLSVIDCLCIGGGMAYTFLKALGYRVGRSNCELEWVGAAKQLMEEAKIRHVEVFLPIDHVCHTEVRPVEKPLTTSDANIPDDFIGLDIGPKTVSLYSKIISESKTCIWNGPLGVFEIPCYAKGTLAIAKSLGRILASAAELSGEAPRMSHVSTGGGASLELLEGKVLPGVAILDDQE
eukprot:gene12979-8830_t